MDKKGQIQISFGFIISVIVIAATLAVAIYVIYLFINIDDEAECKMFNDDLQKKINEMWGANVDESYAFSRNAPPKATHVCFGLETQSLANSNQQKIYDEVRKYSNSKNNVHFYPPKSCGDATTGYTLDYMNATSFFCVQVSKGKANFKLVKGSFDTSVKVVP